MMVWFWTHQTLEKKFSHVYFFSSKCLLELFHLRTLPAFFNYCASYLIRDHLNVQITTGHVVFQNVLPKSCRLCNDMLIFCDENYLTFVCSGDTFVRFKSIHRFYFLHFPPNPLWMLPKWPRLPICAFVSVVRSGFDGVWSKPLLSNWVFARCAGAGGLLCRMAS